MRSPIDIDSIMAMRDEIDGIDHQFAHNAISLEEFFTYLQTRFKQAVQDVDFIAEEAYMVGGLPMLLSRGLTSSIMVQSADVRSTASLEAWIACCEAMELTAMHLAPHLQRHIEQSWKIFEALLNGQIARLSSEFPDMPMPQLYRKAQ